MTTITLAICGVGMVIGGIGYLLALGGSKGLDDSQRSSSRDGVPVRAVPIRQGPLPPDRSSRGWSPKVGVTLASALVVGSITRWPVAGLLAAVVAFTGPSILKATTSGDSTRRTEAVAVWTELLRDTLSASAGLAQAIVATAEVAPQEIRVFVVHLADRIMSGVSMDDALRAFAIEVGEPSAEQVVHALRLAVTSRAQRLVDLLGALAESTREEVAMRLRVEASRASARSSVRTVIWFSVGFMALLTIVAHSYLAPFGTVTGQLVLGFVGACYAAGVALMVRLVQPPSSTEFSREELRI